MLVRMDNLIENGADINIRNGCPLILVCHNGNIDIVKCLYENGANIHTSKIIVFCIVHVIMED